MEKGLPESQINTQCPFHTASLLPPLTDIFRTQTGNLPSHVTIFQLNLLYNILQAKWAEVCFYRLHRGELGIVAVPSRQLSIKAPGHLEFPIFGSIDPKQCHFFLRCPQSFRGTRARCTEGWGSVTLDLTEHGNGIVSGYVPSTALSSVHTKLQVWAHEEGTLTNQGEACGELIHDKQLTAYSSALSKKG